MKETARLSLVSLFTGAGGLDVGFEMRGGFDLLACVELEPRFCETLTANRDSGRLGSQNTKILQRDLSVFTPEELLAELDLKPGELDVLIGGPPCQSWSTAGRRGTMDDPRGQLIWNFLRFVEVLQPKIFVMENVRGLLSGAIRHRPIAQRPTNGGPPLASDELPGSAIALWADDLSRIADGTYRVDVFEVNAVNYGAPQLRERVLFFGNRLGLSVTFPAPTHGPDSNLQPYRTLRDAIGAFRDPDPVVVDFSPRKKHYLAMVPPGGNWRSLPDDIARESMGRAYFAKGGRSGWWRRLDWDAPCPTVTTMPNHSSTSLCHPHELRAISVAEAARIQEFPDGWEFRGSPVEQMKQIGNAVPTRLGAIAATVVSEVVSAEPSDSAELPSFVQHYVKSHVRTRRWWHGGRAVSSLDDANSEAIGA